MKRIVISIAIILIVVFTLYKVIPQKDKQTISEPKNNSTLKETNRESNISNDDLDKDITIKTTTSTKQERVNNTTTTKKIDVSKTTFTTTKKTISTATTLTTTTSKNINTITTIKTTTQNLTTTKKTQIQINDELRKSIQNRYGLTIKYGEEMGDYRLQGYLPNKLINPNEIYESLKDIQTHVAYYPIGFFKEMKDYGMPLTIYLVKNIPGSDIAGIADKEFYSDIKITICTDQFFFRVFHHEVFHYIEAYMEIVGYKNGIFTNWNLLNPEGFVYGNVNSSYSYSLLDTSKKSYFINDYGQTNDREDRATIFEDLMARAYETPNSYVLSNKIWDKGKMIAEEIDKYFDTVNNKTIERWERFINN